MIKRNLFIQFYHLFIKRYNCIYIDIDCDKKKTSVSDLNISCRKFFLFQRYLIIETKHGYHIKLLNPHKKINGMTILNTMLIFRADYAFIRTFINLGSQALFYVRRSRKNYKVIVDSYTGGSHDQKGL